MHNPASIELGPAALPTAAKRDLTRLRTATQLAFHDPVKSGLLSMIR